MKDAVYEILSGDTVCCEYAGGTLSVIDDRLAPMYLRDFRAWVASRAIAASRGLTSRNVKAASGLSANEYDFETAMKAHAACVTDNYWVRLKGSALRYSDVCFDGYNGHFSRLALGLDNSWHDYASDEPNPELTNIGNSDKSWYVDESGRRWLYKKQPINECYNEVLASKLAAKLGIDTVEYELVYASDPDPELGRYGIIRSADFTQDRKLNFEPAHLLLQHHGTRDSDIAANADIFAEMGLAGEYLDIQYLDIITGNPDRHSFNYGVLRDRLTGGITGMAPNFDNNFAFFAETMPTDQFVHAAEKYDWVAPGSCVRSYTSSAAPATSCAAPAAKPDRTQAVVTPDLIEELITEMRAITGFGGYEDLRAILSIKMRNDILLEQMSRQ